MTSPRESGPVVLRKRTDAEIDKCIADGVLFGFRTVVAHAEWDGHLRQVRVRCKCGKEETVKYAWLKNRAKIGRMGQCRECGNEAKSGVNHPWFSGGGKRGPGVARATNKYRREHPNCERCGSSENVHVDHRLPVSSHPDLATSPENFESLCAVCHAQKTIDDGMGHVAPMLLSGPKSSAIPTNCTYCQAPMLAYPTRREPRMFCSMLCKGLSMRKLNPESAALVCSTYLTGGVSMESLAKQHSVSVGTIRYALKLCGASTKTIAKIAKANTGAAKRTNEARAKTSQKLLGRSAKLDESRVREIKLLLRAGDLYQKDIAAMYSVSLATINHIATGKNWSWIA